MYLWLLTHTQATGTHRRCASPNAVPTGGRRVNFIHVIRKVSPSFEEAVCPPLVGPRSRRAAVGWRSACIAAMASMEGADGEWLGLPSSDGNQNEGLPAHRREELAAEAALLEDKVRVPRRVLRTACRAARAGPWRAPGARVPPASGGWTQRRSGHSFACAHTGPTRGGAWDAVTGSPGPKQGTRRPPCVVAPPSLTLCVLWYSWTSPSSTSPARCSRP
jgi:hypothetical protein